MGEMTKFLAELLFSQVKQALIDLAPLFTTAVVGFATVKINQLVNAQNKHKGAQEKAERLRALEYAAITFVRSQYEKDRAVFKDKENPEQGIDPGVRKQSVMGHLSKLFPEFSQEDLDAACDAAVFLVRSEKQPVDPSI